jgi:hypothetical protein
VCLVERLEERRFRVADTSRRDICVQILFRFVMQPHQLLLIPFFKEAEPGTLASL